MCTRSLILPVGNIVPPPIKAAATEALSNIDSRRADLAAEEQAVREAFRNQMGERFAVSLSRVEGSLGFVFATDHSGEKYVESVTLEGPADGKLKVDDIIDVRTDSYQLVPEPPKKQKNC